MDPRRPGTRPDRSALALLACTLALAGCVGTESPFEQTVGDASSSYSAAATTIRFVQDGRLTVEYAHTTLDLLKESLDGVEEDLPKLGGRPVGFDLAPLTEAYEQATPVLEAPCLLEGCDWDSQISALDRAFKAFADARDAAAGASGG